MQQSLGDSLNLYGALGKVSPKFQGGDSKGRQDMFPVQGTFGPIFKGQQGTAIKKIGKFLRVQRNFKYSYHKIDKAFIIDIVEA